MSIETLEEVRSVVSETDEFDSQENSHAHAVFGNLSQSSFG